MDDGNEREQRYENIILELNKSGLSYLTHQQFSQAFEYFKQSEKVVLNELRIDPRNMRLNKLAGITYNNLACYYKKTNKPKISLIYLQKALEVEVHRVEDWTATASTHLNICAIHSYLKDHQAAANHAQLALNMLSKLEKNSNEQVLKSARRGEQERSVGNLYMLGHYNLAIELEYLKRYEESIEEFTKAKEWAQQLGKKNAGIILAADQSIVRMRQNMNHLKDKLIRIITKRRNDEEKGYYSFMRKNKRHIKVRQSEGSLPKNIKNLKLYEQRPHYRTKSILRLKTSPKNDRSEVEHNRNTSFSHL